MATSPGGALGDAGTRDAALRWAASARSTRHEVRRALGAGDTTLVEVLAQATTDPLLGQVKLQWVLESLPGARKIDTRRRLTELGLDGVGSLSQLGPDQHDVVVSNFDRAVGG